MLKAQMRERELARQQDRATLALEDSSPPASSVLGKTSYVDDERAIASGGSRSTRTGAPDSKSEVASVKSDTLALQQTQARTEQKVSALANELHGVQVDVTRAIQRVQEELQEEVERLSPPTRGTEVADAPALSFGDRMYELGAASPPVAAGSSPDSFRRGTFGSRAALSPEERHTLDKKRARQR
jgi:hypothetical protein